jgi:nitrogen fixation protein FixH
MSLGEALTRSETIKDDAQGFNENAKTAKRGGAIAGKARLTVEKETGKKVVSKETFLATPKKTDGVVEGE